MQTVTMPRWIGSTGKLSWLLICSVVITWYWLIDASKACLLSLDNFLTGMPRSYNKPTWRTVVSPKEGMQNTAACRKRTGDLPSGPGRIGAPSLVRHPEGTGRHLAATGRSSVPGVPVHPRAEEEHMDDDAPQYLSREWENQQHEWLEEQYGDGGGCGGLGRSDPCGGCIDCMHAQMSYYISEERKQARTYHAAGFEFLQPGVVKLEWESGMSAGHDSYNCKMAGELYDYSFPWEKKGS